ncbi:MAG: hypothetical protein LIO69_07910 [Oscillospiraceae bacterium]|nr:hypothetical protein [Oscillospiraceae bacterium]
MFFRILKAWLYWRKDWDSLCNRCGKCCYTRSFGDKGEIIIHYDDPCVNLDTETNLCRIYKDRFRKCIGCGKVNLFVALFYPSMPKDCAYVQTFRLWRKQKENEE